MLACGHLNDQPFRAARTFPPFAVYEHLGVAGLNTDRERTEPRLISASARAARWWLDRWGLGWPLLRVSERVRGPRRGRTGRWHRSRIGHFAGFQRLHRVPDSEGGSRLAIDSLTDASVTLEVQLDVMLTGIETQTLEKTIEIVNPPM
jgi:hypothetical protein